MLSVHVVITGDTCMTVFSMRQNTNGIIHRPISSVNPILLLSKHLT